MEYIRLVVYILVVYRLAVYTLPRQIFKKKKTLPRQNNVLPYPCMLTVMSNTLRKKKTVMLNLAKSVMASTV
jgi:hypothetical protein